MSLENGEMGVCFLRSCKKECEEPVSGHVKGHVPCWLQGTLIRIGPGLMEIGSRKYEHAFDGLALMHQFQIKNGQILYRNRFLRSDTYKRNMQSKDIVMPEFGTKASPDPCKTIFERFASLFSPIEFSDNDLINIVRYCDEYYACTETTHVWNIDPVTLESVKKMDISNHVAVKTSLAHTHEDSDGTVYTMGNNFLKFSYAIVKFPPKAVTTCGVFDGGSIVCHIPFSRPFHPSYYHSFAMTKNYFIFVEQALQIVVSRILLSKIIPRAYADYLNWDPLRKTRFFVVRRKNGAVLNIRYIAEPFFVFHHINAFEDGGCICVDMCCYKDAGLINALYVKSLEQGADDPEKSIRSVIEAQAKRYILPLEELVGRKAENENILADHSCKASAYKLRDGSVICQPAILTGPDPWNVEMPRINYVYNGVKYKYFYGIGARKDFGNVSLVKVHTETGAVQSWSEEGSVASEPVFISDPNSGEEDNGVILASLLFKNQPQKVSLLILDAKTMTEMARANFETESAVPGDIHGIFISS